MSGEYFIIANILKLVLIVAIGLTIAGVLHFLDIPLEIYDIVSRAIGIYHMEHTNLFLIILYEQLFANYLLTSMLICVAIVFCYKPIPKNLKENLECMI